MGNESSVYVWVSFISIIKSSEILDDSLDDSMSSILSALVMPDAEGSFSFAFFIFMKSRASWLSGTS